jgi:(p)ppGpp synthase/HD superfamily hydrolase
MEPFLLTDRFQAALNMSFELHQNQIRKGAQVPYYSHLMSVSALVLENGGTENQAIAALLHDAVEDQGGLPVLERIREEFGEEVANIVDGCTDAYTHPKPDWKERKSNYLARLKTAPDSVLLVSLSDKVHNSRSILRDLQKEGDKIWDWFKGKKNGTLWYYQSLANIFDESPYPFLKQELRQLVEELITLAYLKETGV